MLFDLLQAEDDATNMIANMRRYRFVRSWFAEHSMMHAALYTAMGWFAPRGAIGGPPW